MHVARLLVFSALAGFSSPALGAPATPRIDVIDDIDAEPSALPSTTTPATPAASRESRIAEARRLGSRGLAAFDQHSYPTAIDSLTRALELHEAPSLRLYRARAYGKLERWQAACDDYRAILRSPAADAETSVAAEARAAALPESEDACARPHAAQDEVDASAEPPSPPSPTPDTARATPHDTAPRSTAAPGARARATPELELDVSLIGAMHNQIDYSRSAFDSYERDTASIAGRAALAWHPLDEPIGDWLGFGASWVQDYGTGAFHYTEALAAVTSQHAIRHWRFGAELGAGFLRHGMDVLNQRYTLVKPSLEAGVRFGDFSADASAAMSIPVVAHEGSLYSVFSGYGVEGRVELGYRLWPSIGVQLSAALNRLALQLDERTRTVLADGARVPSSVSIVDRYTSLFLGFTANL